MSKPIPHMRGYSLEERECGDCAHFKDMGPNNKPDICRKKLMGVGRTMKVTFETTEGTCWTPAAPVQGVETTKEGNPDGK